ncbi:LysR family transcriptional regulator [Kushneria konosiri]|uniref:HTH lysR-type domain-containing protein n=1 Tax=Kushneria konosiri TaxID=698828 RepID=A0A2Z2H6K8_9GAMM|nr:LysR family transcriptional regulator [Kushneria konosiri]ARS52516.1 hypothetical protein B9G99_06165 [Kushneria konosiri]
MKNIPTDLLRTFTTIKDLNGFTSAGDALGRSQPAISLQIKKLEILLNTQIFVRGSHLELTADGEELYKLATQILQLNDSLVEKFHSDNVYGKIKLGIPNDYELAFLPEIIKGLTNRYPNILIEVDCDISKNIYQKFQKHQFDICLAMQPLEEFSDFLPENYLIEELKWGYTQNLSLQGKELPLVTYPNGCLYRKITEKALTDANIPFRIVYTSPSLLGIVSAVEKGLGITAMARSVIPRQLTSNTFLSEDLPNMDKVGVGFYYRESELTSAGKLTLDYLRAGLRSLRVDDLPIELSKYCS